MKFFAAATAFLACTVSLASANTPEELYSLGTVTSDYYAELNRFTLEFTGGTSVVATQLFTSGFYDHDSCAGTQYTGGEIVSELWGFTSANTFLNKRKDVAVVSSNPVHQFTLDMTEVKDSTMWVANEENEGYGDIKFCVRSIIGSESIPVNFIETQISVRIDLLANVVTDVSVQKRTPTEEDDFTETYTVNCFICDGSGVAGGKGSAADEVARQGEMVKVCMVPEQDDVAIISLKSFNWTLDGSDGQGDNLQQVVLAANADTAANPLSTTPDCNRGNSPVVIGSPCGFQSMMRASFYDGTKSNEIVNNVDGQGQVLLALNRRNRRLNEIDVNDARTQRLLQGVGGDVNVRVPISSEDTGPGSLKTAGGASFGTAFASGIALLGAVLFA